MIEYSGAVVCLILLLGIVYSVWEWARVGDRKSNFKVILIWVAVLVAVGVGGMVYESMSERNRYGIGGFFAGGLCVFGFLYPSMVARR